MAFSGEPVAQLGGLQHGDCVGDAQREDAPAVGHGRKGQVGQGEENTALTHTRPVQVVLLHGDFRTGVPQADFCQLHSDAPGKTVTLVQVFDK